MYNLISNNFSLDDIKLVCDRYGVDIEDLSGQSKKIKALELVKHAQRHRRTPELARAAAEVRQDLDWTPWGGPPPVLTLHRALREMISAAFNNEEINTAAFDLGYRDMPRGVGRMVLVNELVGYAIQQKLVDRLLGYVQRNNPTRYTEWLDSVRRARAAHQEQAEPLVSRSEQRFMVCPQCGGTGRVSR